MAAFFCSGDDLVRSVVVNNELCKRSSKMNFVIVRTDCDNSYL